jgi:hypothetical protein
MVSAYSEHDGKSSAEEESFSTGFRAQSASGSDGYRAQQRRAVPILRQLIANGYQPLTIVPPAAEPPGFLEGKPREQFLDARGKAPAGTTAGGGATCRGGGPGTRARPTSTRLPPGRSHRTSA